MVKLSDRQHHRVHIVREEITALREGVVEWTYSSDIGVIFELSESAVGIVQASHHIEALFVSAYDAPIVCQAVLSQFSY